MKEEEIIFNELPHEPRHSAAGPWLPQYGWPKDHKNAAVFQSVRDGKLFVSIYLTEGGWLGVELEQIVGDLAPFHG